MHTDINRSFMRKILFILLLCPLLSVSQEPKPLYKNDTLYATCGYKIYKGLTLQFGNGTGKNGKFRYIKINNHVSYAALVNNFIVVTEMKKFWVSRADIAYVQITGAIIFKDNSKGAVDMDIAFDLAIENSPGLPGELLVPAEFKNNRRVILRNQLNRLFKLYTNGTINKTEYESQKKKLLEQ